MDNTCSTCVYYQRSAQLGQGECWRYPPKPFPMQNEFGAMGTFSIRPVTQAQQTCGEWRRDQAEPTEVVEKPFDFEVLKEANRFA